jgi:hypothetical protein
VKDLDNPEHRAMEREQLRAAREHAKRGERDYSHIGIGIVLLLIAVVLYAVGSAWAAGLVVLGAILEIGGWAILFNGGRKFEEPKRESGSDDV